VLWGKKSGFGLYKGVAFVVTLIFNCLEVVSRLFLLFKRSFAIFSHHFH